MPASFIDERRATYAGFETRELAVTGTGCTVILVHGFAHSADAWLSVLEVLHDAGQAAVAVDLPGFGDADALRPGALLPQLDAFLAEVVHRYGANDPAVLVGNSLGAAVAARAARNPGLPIRAVMPLDIAGVRWTLLLARGLPPIVASTRRLSSVRVPPRAHRALVHNAVARLLYGQPSAIDPAVVALVVAGIPDLAAASRLLQQGAQFKAELDRTRHHGGIGIPMTVIHGLRDRLVPSTASRVLHQANPGSRLVLLKRAGHCPQLDAPNDIAHHACELARITTDMEEIS
ncbi:alpha/beta hydrolase [Mycobacterium sp. CPCC 205372]|uniref:Alpha/beta hydrolase n=1 Tax=Mycobacterium hippophais TaxID=3016340 RepID=A0ABT4PXG0_9MYCO|nr:alpha/beta hydrolase [Mycobacterium hippophais]MCZ8381277.1 alpha/beta hydrolase [Mycobacterium hippophais]